MFCVHFPLFIFIFEFHIPSKFDIFFYHRFILAKVVTKRFHIETPSFQILIALFVNDISPYVYFNNYSSRRVQLQEGINRKIFIWADEVSLKHKIVKTWNFMVKNSSRLHRHLSQKNDWWTFAIPTLILIKICLLIQTSSWSQEF